MSALLLAAAAGGCAATAGHECLPDPALLDAAPADSLVIDRFLRGEAVGMAAARSEAVGLRRRAGLARAPGERIGLAAAAAAAAPDDPDLWLESAAAWRAAGDDLRGGAALDAAAAAVRRLNDVGAPLGARGAAYRRGVALATALAQAWLHYDRAEWAEADDWARAALALEPASPAALQVRGLVQGRLGQTTRVFAIADDLRRRDIFSPYARWMLAAHDESLGRLRGALGQFLDLTPHPARALECYRDMAALAEKLGEWAQVERWYVHSAAASPLAGTPCLSRVMLPRLEPGPDGSPPHQLPVWLAFGRHYVTGSLSAYARHAFAGFDTAASADERELWAGLTVNAAGILLRREPESPWALRVRGLVFAASGDAGQGLSDLRRAADALASAGLPPDARIESELGRLLLAREDIAGALPRLRLAVDLDPAAAAAWADLGMALATTGDAAGALEALGRAIDIAPERPTAWYNRGLLHLRAQRLDEAEHDLGRAAALAPDNQDIPRLLQQIRVARSRGTPGPGREPGP
ncbi:MAG: tetratricopeptide repeat protein [bacterium]|nr:tetratricopeptide repeat protein [bacterium]